jgi:Tfp pilus tip-associated adhesin PilY1
LYNQPKVAALYDGTGNTGDYYIGTGDALNPSNPSVSTNYFYAIHDRNQQSGGPTDDGQPLWVVRFPNTNEQVVSTPAIISGAIIVATYVPPGGGAQCSLNGDTYLYAFDPVTGALTPALVTSQSTAPGVPPTTSSVMKLTNVGIPSDLLVVGDTLFMSTSNGGIMSTPVKPKPTGGDIRSFRRLR